MKTIEDVTAWEQYQFEEEESCNIAVLKSIDLRDGEERKRKNGKVERE